MKRLLLVEDTLPLAEEIADVLRLSGYEVITAHNGQEALDILLTYTPDLIITDLLMPGMDGFALIGQLRELPRFSQIPIVILSARTSEEDRARGLKLRANAFVGKPCTEHELIATVEALLGKI